MTKKSMTLSLDEGLILALKLIAAKKNTTVSDLVATAVNATLADDLAAAARILRGQW